MMTLYKETGDSKMKKKVCLFGIIVGIVCTVIYGCSCSMDDTNENSHITENSISSATDITENVFSDYSASEEKLIAIEYSYLNDNGFVEDENITPLLDEVEKEILKEVEEGKVQTYNRSNENIYIKYKGNIGYLFVPYQEDILGMGENNNIITLEPNQDDYSVGIARFETWIDKKYNDLEYQGSYSLAANAKMITDKYPDKYVYNQNPSMDYIYGLDDEYSSFANSHVTIDRLKTLDDYEIIIFEGHGGYNEQINSVIFSGETFVGWKEFSKYKEDIAKGEIVLSSFPSINNVPYSVTRTYGVTSKFFEKYCGKMDNAIVYLGSCNSCKDSVLANTFLSKGASVVLGYNETVTMVYEMIARTLFFYNLTNDDISVSEAFARTVNRIGKDSNNKGAKGAELVFFDKDDSASMCKLSGNSTSKNVYTAEDLINKPVKEIVELMGDTFDVDKYQSFFYNNDVFPGLEFYVDCWENDENKLKEAIKKNNPKLIGIQVNDSGAGFRYKDTVINADMDFSALSSVFGEIKCKRGTGALISGAWEGIAYTTETDNCKATINFDVNWDVSKYLSEDIEIPVSEMKEHNPKIKNIAIVIKSESTTNTPEDWKSIYKTKLQEKAKEYSGSEYDAKFELVDIDQNGSPELFISPAEFRTSACEVYTICDGSIKQLQVSTMYGGLHYNSKEKIIGDVHIYNLGSTVLYWAAKLENGDIKVIYSSDAHDDTFTVNGENVTLEEYKAANAKYPIQGGEDWKFVGRKHSLNSSEIDNVLGISDSQKTDSPTTSDQSFVSDIIQTYNGTTYYAKTTAAGGGSRTIDFSNSKYVNYSVLPISANKSEQYIYSFIIFNDKVYYTLSGKGSAVDSWTLKCCDLDGSNISVLLENVISRFEINNGLLTIRKSSFDSNSSYKVNLSTGESVTEESVITENKKTVSNCGLADDPTEFDGGLYYREYTDNSVEVIYYRKDINTGTAEKIGSGFQPSR